MSKATTPLMPPATERTTTEQDWADFFLYLEGKLDWHPRFAKFRPKAQPDSLEGYLMTNSL